jgi:tetratricopeptide (TPR) repeat protein
LNITDYTYLINKPDALNDRHSEALEKIIEEFPYFQSARILRLKHLYNQDSFKYNYALKVAAAYTTDRSVLFDFITSDNFVTVQNGLYEQKIAELFNIDVIASEIVEVEKPKEIKENTLEKSILSSIKESNPIEEKLEIGKPLDFSISETHSFQEWLQLSRFKPIDRTENKNSLSENDAERRKKIEIIDKFIETNPKITPIEKNSKTPVFEPIIEDKSYLMTETLARVYLEQKKYDKAIQAYEILILKYPEKSSFFANRISEIKELQNNNN